MIELTRLNNRPLVVNSDLIKFMENTPDTVLTLITGEKVVVSEPSQVVIEKIIEFRRKTGVGSVCPTGTWDPDLERRNRSPEDEDDDDFED